MPFSQSFVDACKNGHKESVIVLLGDGTDPNQNDEVRGVQTTIGVVRHKILC